MPKLKIRKSISKRVKITANNKILRRHQLGAGHLKRHKGKSALERQVKDVLYSKGEAKNIRKGLGIKNG